MQLAQTVSMAFKAISGNKVRAFLTMLGVIIGGACYAINTLQNYEMFIKLLILGLFYLLTSPISGHAIAKGAYHHGVKMDEKSVCDKYGEDME